MIVADDYFAGAGGWDLGGLRLGIHARGIENMKEARATRDAAGLETIHGDVWTFQPDGRAEGLIASPPCQTFSAAGKGSGRKALDDVLGIIRRNEFIDMDTLRARAAELGDDRTGLVLTPLHFLVNYPNYRWAAWEQVPTVQPVWDACADKLRSWGWNVWTGRMQAEQYGVPQTRKRSILIASRDHEVGMPTPTHSKFYNRDPKRRDEGVLSWVSMAEGLGWAEGGGNHPDAGDVVMVSNYGTGGDPRNRGRRTFDEPAPTVTPKIDRNRIEVYPDMMGDVRASRGTVRSVDEPSPTLTGSMDNGNFRWLTTPDGEPRFKPEIVSAPGYRATVSRQNQPHSVRVTVQEAGVLQSYPETYPFQGSKGKQYLQVGNSIPPLLATHILTEAAGLGDNTRDEEEMAA